MTLTLERTDAIATCLLGVLTGLWLRRPELPERTKLMGLAGAGVVMVGAGFLWGLQFPVIKKLWTSSYVLVAGGYSMLLLAPFYWVIDVRRWAVWAQPFVWIGMNPITLYMLGNLIEFDPVAERILGGPVSAFLDQHLTAGAGPLLVSLGGMALAVLVGWFLYRRKLFLRV